MTVSVERLAVGFSGDPLDSSISAKIFGTFLDFVSKRLASLSSWATENCPFEGIDALDDCSESHQDEDSWRVNATRLWMDS